ncbi:MAG: flagellar hook-basal body complex protein FliE [Deltaproteobacteria bacterium]|nr:flagellar hook-basal body complex protein FliE [Deltaproteobacteria bacterium]
MSEIKIENLQQTPVKNIENVRHKNSAEFGGVLKGAISRVSSLEKETDRSIVELLKGNADIPETMIGLQKLDISMRLLLTIRNKAIEAYREMMRMQF